MLYFEGEGVKQDYNLASKHFKLSSNQGDAGDQNCPCSLYSYGKGVKQDYNLASKHFKLSSNQGYSGDQYNLG